MTAMEYAVMDIESRRKQAEKRLAHDIEWFLRNVNSIDMSNRSVLSSAAALVYELNSSLVMDIMVGMGQLTALEQDAVMANIAADKKEA